jgi:hypothetical protein
VEHGEGDAVGVDELARGVARFVEGDPDHAQPAPLVPAVEALEDHRVARHLRPSRVHEDDHRRRAEVLAQAGGPALHGGELDVGCLLPRAEVHDGLAAQVQEAQDDRDRDQPRRQRTADPTHAAIVTVGGHLQ